MAGCVKGSVRRCRLGYQLGVQLAQQPQGIVTLYPEVLDPLGTSPVHHLAHRVNAAVMSCSQACTQAHSKCSIHGMHLQSPQSSQMCEGLFAILVV